MIIKNLRVHQQEGGESTSEDGWIKVPGGYKKQPGKEQKYYVAEDGRLIPSWRANNLDRASFNRSFCHVMRTDQIGPFVLTDQINFEKPVNNISVADITFNRAENRDNDLNFNMWAENNVMMRYSKYRFTTDFRQGSGNYVAWQISGYSFSGGQVGYFTLTVTL